MISVIPDIHADAQRLRKTLAMIDPADRIVFLGDLIDAGSAVVNPSDHEVLETAHELIASGKALGIMGNHELNAILFHRQGPNGPLRQHSDKNRQQHESFLTTFGIATPEASRWTNWFLEALPLWREIDGLRLTHAYWGEEQIRLISKRRPDGFLTESDILEIGEGRSAFAEAVKLLVSGPELPLPDEYRITDSYGRPRYEVRVAWWMDGEVPWKKAAQSVVNMDELPEGDVPADALANLRPDGGPVLFGHYKIVGNPRILNGTAACLDFPEVPCFYRWRGEDVVSEDNLVVVQAR